MFKLTAKNEIVHENLIIYLTFPSLALLPL